MTEQTKVRNHLQNVSFWLVLTIVSVLVLADFFIPDETFQIRTEILVAIALMAFLVLSGSFDKLAVGRLLTVERNLKQETHKKEAAEKRNDELIKNFVTFSTQLNFANSNRNEFHLFSPEFASRLGVTQAEESEIQQATEDEIEATDAGANVSSGTGRVAPERPSDTSDILRSFKARQAMERHAIDKYLNENEIPLDKVKREVRFTSAFQSLDPIMERSTLYAGHYEARNGEVFIDATPKPANPMMFDRLYVRLSKIHFYRTAKKLDARLVLILWERPEQTSPMRSSMVDRLREFFKPALENDLLEIVEVEFDETELNQIREELGQR